MHLVVRLFASAREAIGASTMDVDVPLGANLGTLMAKFRHAHPQLASAPSLLVSVNMEYAGNDQALREDDEIALIPPVSGGAPQLEITDQELTADSVIRLVASPECGAVTVFLGTARRMSRGKEVSYLEYEAYPAMAVAKLQQIANEIRERWATDRLAVRHRVGRVELGEASVAIAVATEHRAEGFAACQYAIDRLKAIVPIWKKEVWVGGGEWIGWDCVEEPEGAGSGAPSARS